MPAKRRTIADVTDAEIFTAVGKAMFEGEDWPSRFGAELQLSKQTVRNIRREAVTLLPETAAEMLALAERRATETAKARDALKAWIKHHLT